jgi:hypothetical protein
MLFSFLKALNSLTKRRKLWSIAVFEVDSLDLLSGESTFKIVKNIGEVGFRLSKKFKSISADPFLFHYDDQLYLFYEVKTDHGRGEIHAASMSLNGKWIDHGLVLKEEHHLSYPQVFCYQSRIFMIPEAAQSGKVLLYESKNFPLKWNPISVMIDEPLRDPTLLIIDNDTFYIYGTTEKFELCLYQSGSLFEKFARVSILTKDKKCARSAGSFINYNNNMYRPVQDCSEEYGKAVYLMLVDKGMRKDCYAEPILIRPSFPKFITSQAGHHHVSCSEYGNRYYVAIDYKKDDYLINSILLGLLRLV